MLSLWPILCMSIFSVLLSSLSEDSDYSSSETPMSYRTFKSSEDLDFTIVPDNILSLLDLMCNLITYSLLAGDPSPDNSSVLNALRAYSTLRELLLELSEFYDDDLRGLIASYTCLFSVIFCIFNFYK